MSANTKVQWRPRKKDEAGNYNEDRAEWGQAAVEAYSAIKGSSDDAPSDLGDCIADLMHYAASIGIEPETILQTACTHFEAER